MMFNFNLLIFDFFITDGFSFSATSLFIKGIQNFGGAILVGYNGHPTKYQQYFFYKDLYPVLNGYVYYISADKKYVKLNLNDISDVTVLGDKTGVNPKIIVGILAGAIVLSLIRLFAPYITCLVGIVLPT